MMNCKKCNLPLQENSLLCQCGYLNQPEISTRKNLVNSIEPTTKQNPISAFPPPIQGASVSINSLKNSNNFQNIFTVIIYAILSLLLGQIIVKTSSIVQYFRVSYQSSFIIINIFLLSLFIISLIVTLLFYKKQNSTLSLLLGVGFSLLGLFIFSIGSYVILIVISEIIVIVGFTFFSLVAIKTIKSKFYFPTIGLITGMALAQISNLLIEPFGIRTSFLFSIFLTVLLVIVMVVLYFLSIRSNIVKTKNNNVIVYIICMVLFWVWAIVPALVILSKQ